VQISCEEEGETHFALSLVDLNVGLSDLRSDGPQHFVPIDAAFVVQREVRTEAEAQCE
jgi:hypothetical protein